MFEFRTVKFTVAHSMHDLFSLDRIEDPESGSSKGLQIEFDSPPWLPYKFTAPALTVDFRVPQVCEIWAQSSNLGLDLRLRNTASHITGPRADRQEQERAAAPAKIRFSYLFRMEIADKSASNLECSL